MNAVATNAFEFRTPRAACTACNGELIGFNLHDDLQLKCDGPAFQALAKQLWTSRSRDVIFVSKLH